MKKKRMTNAPGTPRLIQMAARNEEEKLNDFLRCDSLRGRKGQMLDIATTIHKEVGKELAKKQRVTNAPDTPRLIQTAAKNEEITRKLSTQGFQIGRWKFALFVKTLETRVVKSN